MLDDSQHLFFLSLSLDMDRRCHFNAHLLVCVGTGVHQIEWTENIYTTETERELTKEKSKYTERQTYTHMTTAE